MRRGARFLRRTALGALAAALAACGTTPDMTLGRQLGAAGAGLLGGLVGEAPPPPERPSREQLEALRLPIIWVSLPEEPGGAGFAGLVENRGRVAFLNDARQSVTLLGARVVATRALGTDLASLRTDLEADPLVAPRPPAQWPTRLERIYWFDDGLGGRFLRAAVCRPRAVGATELEIFGRRTAAMEIEEPCATPYRAWTDRHWIDPETGFVQRTVQWIGPEAGPLDIEIVVPAAVSSSPR